MKSRFFWHGIDVMTGEECTHNHHTRDHALRCARACFLHPDAVKCERHRPTGSGGRTYNRLQKRGVLMEDDDETI